MFTRKQVYSEHLRVFTSPTRNTPHDRLGPGQPSGPPMENERTCGSCRIL